MSDDKTPPEATQIPAPQPLPERFEIPRQAIEKWMQLAPSDPVNVTLTRADLDELFFGLTRTIAIHQFLQDALVKWSNGDADGANQSLDQSRRGNILADNHVRRFFAAIMAGTKK